MVRRKESGFSLLEIIIVMAIAGGLLTMYTRYVRKQADRASQHTIAAALVQEMKGILNFVRDPDIVITDDESNKTEEISNPLYNTDTPDAAYQVRLSNNVNDVDTGSKSEYYLWGDGSDTSQQQRYRFISSDCKVTPKSNYAFEKEYLPCWMNGAAKNSEARIERVGFRGSDLESQQSSINQIDVIVEFNADESSHLLDFDRFQPALAQAFSDAGDSPSHAWVVHRDSANSNWLLVTKNSDGKTPVEFGAVASNINTLNGYTTGEFGVRFTFDLNDNDSGTTTSGGGDMCWNSDDSQVEMCYEQRTGTGTHGENTVLALNMKDAKNTNGDQKLGTLQANVVMENTARKVYMFQRSYGGDLVMDVAGQPTFFQYQDGDDHFFIGDYYINDIEGSKGNYSNGERNVYYYLPDTYDAFELVTPTITDYITHGGYDVQSFESNSDYHPSYDDSIYDNSGQVDRANVPYPVQTCPQVEQNITLRDSHGKTLVDAQGKPRQVEVIRKLFPRLSVAISSVSAYRKGSGANIYEDPSNTRNRLNINTQVGQLAGITVQVGFVPQDLKENGTMPGINNGRHVIYSGYKYIWIISATLGMYDGNSGQGVNVIDPESVSYNVSRWCSTIPQPGTPADLLESYQYQ